MSATPNASSFNNKDNAGFNIKVELGSSARPFELHKKVVIILLLIAILGGFITAIMR